MKNKHKIEVRKDGKRIKTIKRVIWGEAIGNFNPIFCRFSYANRCLVKCTKGDISDPFRRDDSYLNTLYIEIGE